MRTRIWLAGLAFAAAALTGCTSTTTSTDGGDKDTGTSAKAEKSAGEHKPEDDVAVKSCAADSVTGFPQADLAVQNHSSKPSNYLVQIEFTDASGVRSSEGTAALNNLAAGQKANEKAVGLTKAPSGLKCRITKVTRYAS
ncbi:hypothetical protein [Streptomyces sp. NPDC002250]|uniref:hypothetical protein n=1 Tax=Streptomyces sp. NPDC002250 TaxID=3364641 RepID=UPI00368E09FA